MQQHNSGLFWHYSFQKPFEHPGKYQLLMSQDEEQTLKIFIMNKFRLFVVAEEKQIHKIPEGALET